MKKFSISVGDRKFVVKAETEAKAVKKLKDAQARKVKDAHTRVNVGCAEITINNEAKAYSVGSVTYINGRDERTFRDYAKQCIDVANKLKELESKGYRDDVMKAYDSAIKDAGITSNDIKVGAKFYSKNGSYAYVYVIKSVTKDKVVEQKTRYLIAHRDGKTYYLRPDTPYEYGYVADHRNGLNTAIDAIVDAYNRQGVTKTKFDGIWLNSEFIDNSINDSSIKDSEINDKRTVIATKLKKGDVILDEHNKPYKITSIDFEDTYVSLYADNMTGIGNARFTFDNTEKVPVKDSAIKDGRQVDPERIASYAWTIERELLPACYWEAVDELAFKLNTEQDYIREIPKLAKQKFENYIKQVNAEYNKIVAAARAKLSDFDKQAPEQAKAIMKKQENK